MDLNRARYIDKWAGFALCALGYGIERTLGRLAGRHLPPFRATTPPGRARAHPVPRRILGIKFYGLGNIVMLLPVLESVRARFPEAEIDFLTLDSNLPLLARSPAVARAFGVSVASPWALARSLARVLRELRQRRYDVALDFEQFVKISTLLAYLCGAHERIGFNTDGQRRGWLYTTRVVYTDSEHTSRIFLRLTRPLDEAQGPGRSAARADVLPAPRIVIRGDERERVREVLRSQGLRDGHFPLVGIHPGIGMNFYRVPLKRWDPERFARLADMLVERHGAVVVFTGKGAEERELVGGIRAAMHHPAIDACDCFSVPELTACLELCDLVVANDTSAMHLAAAVGTPVVALFGPTAPLHYGPRGAHNLIFYRDLYCSPCLTNYNLKISRCLDPVCMRAITPEEVLAGIEANYLGEAAARAAALRERSAGAGRGGGRAG